LSHVQENQPPGVPPLVLTGERTLPDVPAENYWFRRHLAAYEWIAERVGGLRVADLACGEGYGADLLARRSARVVGVDANPEAHEHARLRYQRQNLSFERALVEEFEGPCDAIVFLQTIEHVHEPESLLDRFAAAAPLSYVSTPNRLTLAPPGAEKSGNPWHLREYALGEYRALLERHFPRVEVWGVFHAGKLRVHDLALRCGWDAVHRALRLTRPFYERFVPAISSSDFRITREGDLDNALDFLAVCQACIETGDASARLKKGGRPWAEREATLMRARGSRKGDDRGPSAKPH
jgi:SAM-dependent methyltransferase